MQKMDIFELYQEACADNNTQQSGMLRPITNFIKWVNIISLQLFNEYFSQAEKNQKIGDMIDAAFKQSKNVVTQVLKGKEHDFIPFPTDYANYSAVRAFKNESSDCGCLNDEFDIFDISNEKLLGKIDDPDFREIREKFKGTSNGEKTARKVPGNKWGGALNHKLKVPGWDNVLITEMEGGFKVVPKGIGIVVLDYYRYPAKAVFGYTTNVDGTVNYIIGTSTQLDWPIQAKPFFLAAIKQRFASFTNQDNKYQQSVLEKKETK